jgi:hypothetical protein
MQATIRSMETRKGAPGRKSPAPGAVKAAKTCVMISGETTMASEAVEEITPCNSPCASSGAVRDMIPWSAGVTTAPSAVSGVRISATVPLSTSAERQEGEDVEDEAVEHGVPLAQVPQDHPDQPALHQRHRDPEKGERQADHPRLPAEAGVAKKAQTAG